MGYSEVGENCKFDIELMFILRTGGISDLVQGNGDILYHQLEIQLSHMQSLFPLIYTQIVEIHVFSIN